MEHKNIYQLVLAGVLCAIGLVVPMVMPKVIIGPMSFTLGEHVAIFWQCLFRLRWQLLSALVQRWAFL